MTRKILITGGAGFIGYHLARHLLMAPDVSLIVVDNLQRGKMDQDFTDFLSDPRVTFIQADLTDPAVYAQFPTDIDHVYHLAAVNGTRLFYEIPQEVLRINTLSLLYILEWIRHLERKPKLCFTSSNEAYAGALKFGILPIPKTKKKTPLN